MKYFRDVWQQNIENAVKDQQLNEIVETVQRHAEAEDIPTATLKEHKCRHIRQ